MVGNLGDSGWPGMHADREVGLSFSSIQQHSGELNPSTASSYPPI